ncbi:MAG TPA: cytochrome c [Rhodanobacteraceae bacterium]|nr:cytochrome c [Rhodanobacteraceae bacterium]
MRRVQSHRFGSVLLAFGLLAFSLHAFAAELTIVLGATPQKLDSRQLLARADVATITIPVDVAYHRTMHYRAVPLAALLKDVAATDHLQFVARDGFAAEMDARLVLGTSGATAWLAIEDPATPWPALGPGKPGAGPFYLVWTHPEAAGINPEQWPYQIATIKRLDALESRYPALLPDAKLPADGPAWRGFAVFRSRCLACHTLNGAGDARIGPDLNRPHNPTEYFRPGFLRAYIRDPQSLRHWPQAKMPASDHATLSDAQLDDLLVYLQHMATRKTPPGDTP